jgi:thymidylate synthase
LDARTSRSGEHNTSRQFLDDIGLNDLEGDTDLYGHTLRHCGAGASSVMPTTPDRVDQLRNVIEIKSTPPYGSTSSRCGTRKRSESPSYPCHGGMIQFFVSMSGDIVRHNQRSVDAFLGLPFNIMSYAVLTYMIAQVCGLRPGDMKIDMGDTHIYSTHADIQIRRMPMKLPTLLQPTS